MEVMEKIDFRELVTMCEREQNYYTKLNHYNPSLRMTTRAQICSLLCGCVKSYLYADYLQKKSIVEDLVHLLRVYDNLNYSINCQDLDNCLDNVVSDLHVAICKDDVNILQIKMELDILYNNIYLSYQI